MFKTEIQTKIEKLEVALANEQENYVTAIRTHQDHSTLRELRNNIHKIKEELTILYRSVNSPE
jgi:HPt (histidine-containing phosphotransfer) domain-containing protein